MLKICFKCGLEKPRTEFYRHSEMGDGLLGKCKECTKQDVQKNYTARRVQYLEYERGRATLPHRVAARAEYAKTEAGKKSHRKSLLLSDRKWPEKRIGRYATGNAIRDGRLTRQPCETCGGTPAQAHHEDYSRPLDVRWLCREHHAAHHRAQRQAAITATS